MKKLYTIGEMSQIFNAKTEKIKADLLVHGFSIDSRTMNAGELFFCIKGENTDGHHYISQALEKGACAVVQILPAFRKPSVKVVFLEFWSRIPIWLCGNGQQIYVNGLPEKCWL